MRKIGNMIIKRFVFTDKIKDRIKKYFEYKKRIKQNIEEIIIELKNELCSTDWEIRSADGYLGTSPDKIVAKKDEYDYLCDDFRVCLELLNEKELKVFQLHMIRGLTSVSVGKIMNLNDRTIRNHVKHIRDKIREEFPYLYEEWKSIRCDTSETNGCYSSIGLLSDYYRNANLGAEWCRDNTHNRKETYRKIYKSKSGCLIPEYMSERFSDNKTKCVYCGIKCFRKKSNKLEELN